MLTLGDKQRLFAKMVPRLLNKAHELGFEVTLGDAFRDERAFGPLGSNFIKKSFHSVVDDENTELHNVIVSAPYGHQRSAHKLRLAIDLNLFRNGVYLSQTASHEPLGAWWEQQHLLTCWGGRFNDGNHYSFHHNNVR